MMISVARDQETSKTGNFPVLAGNLAGIVVIPMVEVNSW